MTGLVLVLLAGEDRFTNDTLLLALAADDGVDVSNVEALLLEEGGWLALDTWTEKINGQLEQISVSSQHIFNHVITQSILFKKLL